MKACLLLTALSLAACSGAQTDVDVAEGDGEPSATAVATVTADAPASAAPTSTGVDASGKLGKICTQKGCKDRLAVHVVNKAGAGELMITAKAGGKMLHCTVAADDKGGLKPLAEGACKGDPELALVLPGGPLAGVAPDGVTPAFTLVASSAPASLELLVVRGRATLFTQTLTPTYETLLPNGPDCPPSCKTSSLVVEAKR